MTDMANEYIETPTNVIIIGRADTATVVGTPAYEQARAAIMPLLIRTGTGISITPKPTADLTGGVDITIGGCTLTLTDKPVSLMELYEESALHNPIFAMSILRGCAGYLDLPAKFAKDGLYSNDNEQLIFWESMSIEEASNSPINYLNSSFGQSVFAHPNLEDDLTRRHLSMVLTMNGGSRIDAERGILMQQRYDDKWFYNDLVDIDGILSSTSTGWLTDDEFLKANRDLVNLLEEATDNSNYEAKEFILSVAHLWLSIRERKGYITVDNELFMEWDGVMYSLRPTDF